MPKARVVSSSSSERKRQPAQSPDARENQLVDLAMSLAEQQLRDGTASSQVITHFLKAGTAKTELELEKLRRENSLLEAKTENLQTAKHIEELYDKAISAMRDYGGKGDPDDY